MLLFDAELAALLARVSGYLSGLVTLCAFARAASEPEVQAHSKALEMSGYSGQFG